MSIVHVQSAVVAAAAAASGAFVNLTDRNMVDFTFGAGAFCQFVMRRDGTYQAFTSTTSISAGDEWYGGNVSNPGDDFYVRLAGTGSVPVGDPTNTWLPMTLNRSWRWEPTEPDGSRAFNGTMEVASDAAGTDIVASAVATISAERSG